MKPAIANCKLVIKALCGKLQSENSTRCRLRTPNQQSAFCRCHAMLAQNLVAAEDLSAELVDPIKDFLSPCELNDFPTLLVVLLAQNKIATRRAAVMAYITSQLLRTLPAIEHGLDPTGLNKIPTVIGDSPEPEKVPSHQTVKLTS